MNPKKIYRYNQRIVAVCLLQSAFLLFSLSTKAQENPDQLPGMTHQIDSLLTDWQEKNYISPATDCTSSDTNPVFTDSVYIDRLSRIPTLIEMPYNEIVRKHIDTYTGRLRNQVAFMLGAANFYMLLFEEALEAYGLPYELKYLPIIESALNPLAVSRSGATGLWQFMLKTAKIYGLEINSLVDERRDPVKATWAAARYLKELYGIYGDWNLVIAAYNCGPGTINKAIHRAGGETDYWKIYNYLPKETREYVPAFIAINYVMTYYCKHNICPLRSTIPSTIDTVHVARTIHFSQIADLCDISLDELKNLNPQYKRNIIPGESKPQTLALPLTVIGNYLDQQDTIYNHRRSELFKNQKVVAVPQTRNATRGSGNLIYHKIQSGETLSSIARKYGVTVNRIKEWNGISGTKITAGKRLKIYK